MAKAKDAQTISAHIPNPLAELLRKRAEGLGWSVSRYVAAVLEHWAENGATPVSQADAALLVMDQDPATKAAVNKLSGKAGTKKLGLSSSYQRPRPPA